MSNETEPSLPLDIPEQPEVVAGQKIAYARVSSKDQNLDRQLAALKKEKVFRVFTDTVSGSSTQRPGLDGALNYVRAGDQLIVVSMDRLARSLIDLHRLVDELTERGVSVKFLKEGQTYSLDSSPVAKLMLGLLGSVAEFERSIIRERQAEGIAKAKARGVYKGRAKVLNEEQVAQAREWVGAGIPKAEVARRLGIGRTTLYKYSPTNGPLEVVSKREKGDSPQNKCKEDSDIEPVRFFHWPLPRHGGCYGDTNAHCYSKQTEGEKRQELCHPAKQTSDDK